MSIILDPRGPYNLPVMVDSLNLNSFSSQTPPYVSKLLIAKGVVRLYYNFVWFTVSFYTKVKAVDLCYLGQHGYC